MTQSMTYCEYYEYYDVTMMTYFRFFALQQWGPAAVLASVLMFSSLSFRDFIQNVREITKLRNCVITLRTYARIPKFLKIGRDFSLPNIIALQLLMHEIIATLNNKMNKINKAISIAQKEFKGTLSYMDLQRIQKQVLIVEIGKQPSSLLQNSLWVGYRNGGMASWLSTLLNQLPHTRFCLYMDEELYGGSEYMYSYYSEYFSKLFHKQYIGTCVYPKNSIASHNLYSFDEVKPINLKRTFEESKLLGIPSVMLDFRPEEHASNDSVKKLVQSHENASYINLPLNEDDLFEQLLHKTGHLPPRTQFITLCAKGYRSLIGYSLMKLIQKPSWDVRLCRSQIQQVKLSLSEQMLKAEKKQAQQLY